jgi:hypothetical protein
LDVWSLGTQALYYFDAAISTTLALGNQLRIRRVKKSEKQSYGELGDEDRGLGWGSEGPLSFVLDCVSRTSREGEETMKKLAISLLLFKRDIWNNGLPWFRLRWGGTRVWQSDQLPPLKDEDLDHGSMLFPGYRLEIPDIDAFRTFRDTCNQTSWHKALYVAVNRLLQAQAREGDAVLEDRLIDMMIACEALVLDGENEKGKNIAHRLGKLQKQQIPHLEKRAVDDLGLAYRLRNDVVHDGEFSSANLAKVPFPEQFVMHIEQYLRIGMVNYIDLTNQGQSKNQIIQYLDGLPRTI